MRLLIITQKVDKNDPILGFFHRWIEEFAKHCDKLTVICLEKGEHSFPSNVKILSLGKDKLTIHNSLFLILAKFKYTFRFYKYIWQERKNYDSVFVHMNQIYVILGSLLWKMWGKKVGLWYTHKHVSFSLRWASLLADHIFTASKESFRLASKKVHVMGHGIDTAFFSPDKNIPRGTTVLSVGRLSPAKRHDLVIRAAEHFPHEVYIAGEGPEKAGLEVLVGRLSLAGRIHFLGPLTQEQLREEYRKAGVLVHTSETGSLDKVILEALACGLPVVTTNAYFSNLPVTVVSATPEDIAKVVNANRQTDVSSLISYVRENHSLSPLVSAILKIMQTI